MTSSSCVAVIVEPRQHPLFAFVVHNVVTHLPDHWSVQVFHGTTNTTFVKQALADLPHVTYTSLGKPNLSADGYNRLLTSPWFWTRVAGEHVLLFQTDSVILDSPHTIDEYLGYDYVGSPWNLAISRADRTGTRDGVGCGGFSLRKKSSALAALPHLDDPVQYGEDVVFAEFFERHPDYTVAPKSVAQTFCMGEVYVDKPFAMHKCWMVLRYPELVRHLATHHTSRYLLAQYKPHLHTRRQWIPIRAS